MTAEELYVTMMIERSGSDSVMPLYSTSGKELTLGIV